MNFCINSYTYLITRYCITQALVTGLDVTVATIYGVKFSTMLLYRQKCLGQKKKSPSACILNIYSLTLGRNFIQDA